MRPARIVGILIFCLFPALVKAADDAALCNAAAMRISQDTLMPQEVLLALTLVETGRKRGGQFQPWPWTVNMEGKGYWFDTRAEALTFVEESYASGARSFDVGCFQINHRWHGEAFTSFNQMFEPLDNARYAAKFMTSLFNEGGSWSWAAGAYHSRTESLASKYRARYERIVANLPNASTQIELPVVIAATERSQNTARLSTWGPFQPLDMEDIPVKNGSLAGGLLTTSSSPLLISANGALF